MIDPHSPDVTLCESDGAGPISTMTRPDALRKGGKPERLMSKQFLTPANHNVTWLFETNSASIEP
ncbi:hypothetical protein DL239_16945 [Sedimentitalea sp. CY04]|uniref:Uncharacterized protein n=1 Tax=Parasedimentitalea denitrificans TaxID=2211118 RepID=A0ABX0WB49_9RHOB|nr:hypothetical protein [Sedimentitalea sp. CY04]